MARTSRSGRRVSVSPRFGPSEGSLAKRWHFVAIAGPLALLIVAAALVGPAAQAAGPAAARKEAPGDREPARLVARSARVLDPNGQPVAVARVEAIAEPEDDDVRRLINPPRQRAETDEAGRFTVRVPPQRDFGIMVRSDRGAVARMVVPAGGEIPADIALERGATLRGRLLDRAGRPVRGCVVAIESDDDQTIQTELSLRPGYDWLAIEIFRVTDAEGRFVFPPLLGDFIVSLKKPEDVFAKDSDGFRGAVPPPPLGPLAIHLDAPGDKVLTLIEAPTATLRGTLRWHDGKPASGLRLEAMLTPRRGNRYLDVGTAKTDEDGRYALRLPLPLDGLEVSLPSQRGLDRNRWAVRPVAPMPGVSHHRWHDLVIGHLDGDREGLGLVIVPKQDAPARAGADDEAGNADDAHLDPDLHALEREILAARKAYADAAKAAKTEEERDRLDALDPRRVMVARCLEVESRHRGTRTGLGALNYVMRAAATSGVSAAIDEALARAIAILGAHYLAHADLDLLLHDLTAGYPAIEAEALLRKIATESPHDYVRVEALYDLAAVLGTQAEILEHYRAHAEEMERDVALMVPMQTSQRARDLLLQGRDHMRKSLAAYDGRDPGAMRTEAERLLDQIVSHFPDVRAPVRHWDGPADLRLVDADPGQTPVFRRWSVPERAEAKLFQRSKLRLDQPAPILEGIDLHLRRSRLSDFLGKVVVLMVTMSTVDDMYDRCKGLLQELAGRPVVCLSVVPSDGDGGYSVRAIVRETGITWPIIRDPRGGPIAHRWCQQTFPEAYVIDPQGRIRFHEAGNDAVSPALVEQVKQLLENAPRL